MMPLIDQLSSEHASFAMVKPCIRVDGVEFSLQAVAKRGNFTTSCQEVEAK